jgi:hypothetical protein
MDFDDLPDDNGGTSLSLANWHGQPTEETRPYEAVCFRLASSCGAIPLQSFLSGEYQHLDLNYHQPRARGKEMTAKGPEKTDGEPSSAVEPDGDFESSRVSRTASLASLPLSQALPPQEALEILHQTCLRLTGTDQALDYGVVEAQPQCSFLSLEPAVVINAWFLCRFRMYPDCDQPEGYQTGVQIWGGKALDS